MTGRTNRIAAEMKKEISDILQRDLKDPRIPELLSVVSVDLSRDLRYAKIYVSMIGNAEEKQNALEGLRSAAGFIRREIGQRIKVHHTPEMLFEMDSSIEYGAYMSALINRTLKDDENKH